MDKAIGTTIRKAPVLLVSFALVVALAAWPARSAELPPAIQADRHLMQAERQIGDGDYAAALASLDGILALQAEHDLAIPDAFWFKHGRSVAGKPGMHAQTAESATRYLETAWAKVGRALHGGAGVAGCRGGGGGSSGGGCGARGKGSRSGCSGGSTR